MPDTTTTLELPIKKKAVRRKTSVTKETDLISSVLSPASKDITLISQIFTDLQNQINQTREDFENLLKEIASLKESWAKEKKDHQIKISERDQQEEITKKREKETYEYETALARQKDQDNFLTKKAQWERELSERKEELAKEKEELNALRKQVASFEVEKEKAVKAALADSEEKMTSEFGTEKMLREQQIKAEKEIFNLKINSLASDNVKQAKEIDNLKRSLEEATRQVKDIAVKVIEARKPASIIPSSENS